MLAVIFIIVVVAVVINQGTVTCLLLVKGPLALEGKPAKPGENSSLEGPGL